MKIFGKIYSRSGGRGRIAGLVLALGLAAGPLAAQESPVYDEPEVEAVISLTVGWTQTGARNDFPSLIVGTSEVGSGVIPGSYARPGSGYGIELEGLIYFNDFIGMTLGLASTRSAAEYEGDSLLLPTRLELQEAEVLLGAHIDIAGNLRRSGAGFRSVYLEGGMEFGIGVMANRVTGSSISDTVNPVREVAEGSFTGGEPFRNRVAFRFDLGTMIDLSGDANGHGMSLIAEVGYSIGLNPVFSSDVVENSSFRTNHLSVRGGLGYRW